MKVDLLFWMGRVVVRVVLIATLVVLWSEASKAANESPPAAPSSIYEFEAKRLGGPVQPLSGFRGEVLLIVNTASHCGYTGQYDGLQKLYSQFRDRGFSVLGFPSNDFRQEPGSDVQIGDFCRSNYGVEFPMFSKVRVRDPDAHPLYGYLTTRPEPVGGPVRWNFQKYLVDRSGRVVARFDPGVRPEDPALVAQIERQLAAPRVRGAANDEGSP